jgi:hypothetical protein
VEEQLQVDVAQPVLLDIGDAGGRYQPLGLLLSHAYLLQPVVLLKLVYLDLVVTLTHHLLLPDVDLQLETCEVLTALYFGVQLADRLVGVQLVHILGVVVVLESTTHVRWQDQFHVDQVQGLPLVQDVHKGCL